MAQAIDVLGSWRWEEAYEENGAQMTLPTEDRDFIFKISAGKEANEYRMGIKIGNSLGASLTLEGGPQEYQAHFGLMRSTMMMPPEHLFKLETFLSDSLPKMTKLSIVDNDKLVMEGASKIVCHRVE